MVAAAISVYVLGSIQFGFPFLRKVCVETIGITLDAVWHFAVRFKTLLASTCLSVYTYSSP